MFVILFLPATVDSENTASDAEAQCVISRFQLIADGVGAGLGECGVREWPVSTLQRDAGYGIGQWQQGEGFGMLFAGDTHAFASVQETAGLFFIGEDDGNLGAAGAEDCAVGVVKAAAKGTGEQERGLAVCSFAGCAQGELGIGVIFFALELVDGHALLFGPVPAVGVGAVAVANEPLGDDARGTAGVEAVVDGPDGQVAAHLLQPGCGGSPAAEYQQQAFCWQGETGLDGAWGKIQAVCCLPGTWFCHKLPLLLLWLHVL